ncbi:RNA-directed RNA polymerase [Dirofilaria immitis]
MHYLSYSSATSQRQSSRPCSLRNLQDIAELRAEERIEKKSDGLYGLLTSNQMKPIQSCVFEDKDDIFSLRNICPNEKLGFSSVDFPT